MLRTLKIMIEQSKELMTSEEIDMTLQEEMSLNSDITSTGEDERNKNMGERNDKDDHQDDPNMKDHHK